MKFVILTVLLVGCATAPNYLSLPGTDLCKVPDNIREYGYTYYGEDSHYWVDYRVACAGGTKIEVKRVMVK